MENRLAELLARPSNKTCIDCGSAHPQWASVNNGVFFCLECSGIHRSLGVQTSFVRSVTMDRWTPQQLAKMEAGGNDRALEFWKSRPDWREGMSIKEKYNSDFARKYRERLNGPSSMNYNAYQYSSSVNSNLSSHSTSLAGCSSGGARQIYTSHTNTNISPNSSNDSSSAGDWFSKIKQQVSSTLIEPVKQYVAANSSSSSSVTSSQRKLKGVGSSVPSDSKSQEDDGWSW